MRILIVTYAFPPLNVIASHRPYSWARTWRDLGHDVEVLTFAKYSFDGSQDLERDVSGIRVEEVAYLPAAQRSAPAAQRTARWERLKTFTRRLRFSMGIFADPRLIAYFPLLRRGMELLAERRVDVIVATSPPEVGFMVARALSRRTGVPWIADFRDLWFRDMLLYRSAVASWLSGLLNRRLVRSAKLLVTVSQGLQARLSGYLSRDVYGSYNGFFTGDLVSDAQYPGNGKRRLVYTGRLYPGKRDPEPLFRALAKLRATVPKLSRRLSVDFYGHDDPWLRSLVERHGVQDCVVMHHFVPYRQSVAIQRGADALLFLDWADARAEGVLTGKLFEYLGSGSPILAIGPTKDSEAARIIAATGCGVTLTRVEEIVSYLHDLLASPPPRVPEGTAAQYSRERQAEELLAAIERRLSAS